MAKTRSPEYPAIGLREAIEKIKIVYEKDYQNKLSKEVIAEHLGYKGLSGASLPILAALSKYGLLEGRGAETRVSDLALTIVVHEPGNGDRLGAIQRAAASPDLFVDLYQKFPNGKGSDAAIRGYLLLQKFIPTAADTAIRSFRETNQLVEAEREAYANANPEAAFQVQMSERMQEYEDAGVPIFPGASAPRQKAPAPRADEPLRAGMRKEIIALDEGDVIITFPDDLSAESFEDLHAYLGLFIKKMQRRANNKKIIDRLPNTDADRKDD